MPAQTVSDVTFTPDAVLELLSAADAVLFSAPLAFDGSSEPVRRNTQPIQSDGNDDQAAAGGGEIRLGRWEYDIILIGDAGALKLSLLTALTTTKKLRLGTDVVLLADAGDWSKEVPLTHEATRLTLSVIPSQHLTEASTKVGLR